MVRRVKREDKIRENPRNVSLKDFEWLINRYGNIKEGSKHAQAIVGKSHMTYKKENPVKTVYIRQLLQMIDEL
jgi:dihydroorotate dehydrogenase